MVDQAGRVVLSRYRIRKHGRQGSGHLAADAGLGISDRCQSST